MEQYLEHHGILGQRWGVRRFQNPDGSLTKAGQKRYGETKEQFGKTDKQIQNRLNDLSKAMAYNNRDIRDNKQRLATLQGNYERNTGKRPTSVDQVRDRDKKKWNKYTENINKASKNLEAGQKEIDSILKDAKDKYIDIESKQIMRDTTRAKENIGMALAIVGATPLAILPGPNALAVSAAVTTANMHKRNMIDSTEYKVGKKKDTRSEEQQEKDADLMRGSNWYLEPNGDPLNSKNRARDVKEAQKYISQMSDEEIKKEIRQHKEAADYHRKQDDYDPKDELYRNLVDTFDDNARIYKNELSRRESKRIEDQIQRENKREKLIDKKTKEIYKQMDKNPPSSSMNKARYLNNLRDQAFDEAYDEIKRTNPELFD